MSGDTVSYEGRFDIISLSGFFLLSEDNGSCHRTGGLSVSLAGSDGIVLGGVLNPNASRLTVPLATRGIAHSTRGRILSGRRSTFSGYLTSGILSGRRSTFSGYLTSGILSGRRSTFSEYLTSGILSADVPPSPDISHPEFCPADVPPSLDISHPEFCPTDVLPSPDISHLEFCLVDVPPSPDISHSAPDTGWERRAIQLPRSDMSKSSDSAYPESIRNRQFRFPGQLGSSDTRNSPDPFPPTIKRQTPIILTTKSPELSLIFNAR
ncbi:hypothetical protein VitviT2T_016724 [Vitis vinifera]|uniref:AT-hook motif nuclear-localized protein n=1 Tax=Vitis vinifera TaxID=29760 RepID=A0ABY9CVJ9_VITVI|nr:hypothetical protein VitviT2T_016724 [Vitis vinifera]